MPKLEFLPKAHGWHFDNTFTNVILPGTPMRFETSGLCGGMVMSALDFWRAGVSIPTHKPSDFGAEDLPADGSRLRTYIYDRQMNSLLTSLMFTRWVVMPWISPQDFHNSATGSEFEIVRRQIDMGRPAMLGLWSMGDGPMSGHQVLCYGYESSPLCLLLYDPNFHDREVRLVPVSPEAGCVIRDGSQDLDTYRGYFWTDVYNWNEPPYQPHYHDLEILSGLTLQPSGDNVPVGSRLDASVAVRNGGEYPARFKKLFVWTRGPGGQNLDHLLGGAEPGLTVLHPGEERLITRRAASFGTEPGAYVVGVSYLSDEDNWHNITMGAPGTTGQRQVVLRVNNTLVYDRTIETRESDWDVDTGIVIEPGMEYSLVAQGSIWAGVWFTGLNGPAGWTDRLETNPASPLHEGPQAHPFALIGRFEGLPYFYIGNGLNRSPYPDVSRRRLWLRINDNVPGNGTGSFRCRIQVWEGQTAPVLYGSTIEVRHWGTARMLHSHSLNYGHPGSSGQQQVTAFDGYDENDLWRVKGPHGQPNDTRFGQPVQHGDIIRLEHSLTARNLHSHRGVPSPVTNQQEVTCYGQNGTGDGNDDWKLDVEGGGAWLPGKRVTLAHVMTSHVLHSHAGHSHPQWTAGQQEVTGYRNRDDNDWWFLSEIR